MKNSTTKLVPTRSYNASPRLTHDLKRELERDIKWLFVNKEFIEFIQETIEKLPHRDKLSCLHYFKKLAIQIRRAPDPDHFKAFEDTYLEQMSMIAEEQAFYEPVRWINAEIEYLMNSAEHLTVEDVNRRLDVMQDAKQRLSKDWLTKEEVMQLFGISKSTVNRRISEGMPCHKKGKLVHFDLKEISEWLKSDAA